MEMKKVLIALLMAVVLSLALVTPVLADEGGQPNDDAAWGQFVRGMAPGGGIGHEIGELFPAEAPLAWGQGGIPGYFGITHGPQ
jgi:hypothetical protein